MPEYNYKLVCEEWNKAELAIKLAEQVNGEIINPAIYELRYAGRRIVEALTIVDEDAIKKLLADAHFDCCRARHDAIDAATSKIAADLEISVHLIGPDIVLTHFKEFPNLYGKLSDVRKLIARSREDRNNRDKIYASIQSGNLSEIIDLYRSYQASEPLLIESARKQRRAALRNSIFGWVGIVSLLLTVIFAFYGPRQLWSLLELAF